MRRPASPASLRALRQRVDGHRRHHREHEQRGGEERDQPPVPPLRLGALLLERPLALVARPPCQDGIGEDVVVDLVATVDGSHDAACAQRSKHGAKVVLPHARVLGEIVGTVGDLRAGRRHEVVEDPGREVLLARAESPNCLVEMRADDRLGPSQLVQRLEPEDTRPLASLGLPEPLQDELQVRRLDPARADRRRGVAVLAAHRDAADLHLIEDGLHEIVLDLHRRLPGELVEAGDRARDGRAGSRPVEAVQREVVAEDVRDAPREHVQLGERVLAERDENVGAQAGPGHHLGE
jgi:hypothetical protein